MRRKRRETKFSASVKWKIVQFTNICAFCGGSSDIIQGRATCEGNEGKRSLVHQWNERLWSLHYFVHSFWKIVFVLASFIIYEVYKIFVLLHWFEWHHPRACNVRRKRRETKFSASSEMKDCEGRATCEGNEGKRSLVQSVKWKKNKFLRWQVLQKSLCISFWKKIAFVRVTSSKGVRRKRRETKFSAISEMKWEV